MQLLHKLQPKPVLRLDGCHARNEFSVANTTSGHFYGFLGTFNAREADEPRRGHQDVRLILGNQLSAFLVDPFNQVKLTFGDLFFDKLIDRCIFTHQRLIGHQRRDKGQGFRQFALQAG